MQASPEVIMRMSLIGPCPAAPTLTKALGGPWPSRSSLRVRRDFPALVPVNLRLITRNVLVWSHRMLAVGLRTLWPSSGSANSLWMCARACVCVVVRKPQSRETPKGAGPEPPQSWPVSPYPYPGSGQDTAASTVSCELPSTRLLLIQTQSVVHWAMSAWGVMTCGGDHGGEGGVCWESLFLNKPLR